MIRPRDAVRKAGRSVIDLQEWLFDARHFIETRTSVYSPSVSAAHAESAAHGTRYEPVRLYVLRRMFAQCRKLGAFPRTFVDIGCGKGRACFFAAASGQYDRVVGVELSESLVVSAQRNLARFRSPCPVEFLGADATRYRIPTEQSLVFLNNPFDASILRQFLDNNIDRFVQARTLIGYAHDFHRRTILDSQFEILSRDHTLNLSIYRAVG
ncbi:MAG TPA: class I SAM-dependent methyltransferase [Steroidobacteraceae bacterium]|nr:class I SAM-dependent methyltransferase [Steroidobacteraceae bacterium]